MRRLAIISALLTSFIAAPAIAADVRVPQQPISHYDVRSVGGFYITGFGGYSRGQLEEDYGDYSYTPFKPKGWVAGAGLGYDHRFSNGVILGLVSDFALTGQKGSKTNSYSFGDCWWDCYSVNVTETYGAQLEWLGTTRGKLGYALGSLTVYGTGGVAYGKVRHSFTSTTTTSWDDNWSFRSKRDQFGVGWTVGVGAEWAMMQNLAVFAEYLHVDLNLAHLSESWNGGTYTTSTRMTDDIVKAGVKWTFLSTN